MPFGKRGSRCCCSTASNPCFGCSGDITNNMQVVLSGVANCGSCSNCSSLDGTYVVPYISNGPCNFLDCFDVSSSSIVACTSIDGFEIQVVIQNLFGTYYVDVNVQTNSDSACGGTGCAGAQFRSTSLSEPSCAFSNYDVPYSSTGVGTECDFSGATCKITAI